MRLTANQVLQENSVIYWLSKDTEKPGEVYERILHVNREKDLVITFNLDETLPALPEQNSLSDMSQQYRTGQFCLFETDMDSWTLPPSFSETQLETMHRRLIILAPILYDQELSMYFTNKRNELLNIQYALGGFSPTTSLKLLRQYWRFGQSEYALIGFENKRGRDPSKPYPKNGKKPGRPKKYSNEHPGVTVDDKLKKKLRKGYLKHYGGNGTLSLKDAYQYTLADIYAEEIEYDEFNRPTISLTCDIDAMPSYGQFYYHTHNDKSLREKAQIKRDGLRKYDRDNAPNRGSVAQYPYGVGDIFFVDDTPLDVQLVFSLDRSILIGKPYCFFAIDCATHLITGFNVSLENPSWLTQAANGLLYSTAEQKEKALLSLGIKIEPSQWPAAGIPRKIFGDRAEFYSKASESLLGHKITITNAPSRAPDKKSIVEALFKFVKEKAINLVSGGGKVELNRGHEKDPRGVPALTLYELRRIVAEFCLHWNQFHTIENYPFDEQMLKEKVPPRPLDLWNWSIENRGGLLRSVSPKHLSQALLPRKAATTCKDGLEFLGNYYYCESIDQQKKNQKKAKISKVKIAYDPRDLRQIYRINTNPKFPLFEPCPLLERSEGYGNLEEHELEIQLIIEDFRKRELSLEKTLEEIQLKLRIDAIASPAKTEAEARRRSAKSEPQGSKPGKREARDAEKHFDRHGLPEDSSVDEIEAQPSGLEVGTDTEWELIETDYDNVFGADEEI